MAPAYCQTTLPGSGNPMGMETTGAGLVLPVPRNRLACGGDGW